MRPPIAFTVMFSVHVTGYALITLHYIRNYL